MGEGGLEGGGMDVGCRGIDPEDGRLRGGRGRGERIPSAGAARGGVRGCSWGGMSVLYTGVRLCEIGIDAGTLWEADGVWVERRGGRGRGWGVVSGPYSVSGVGGEPGG